MKKITNYWTNLLSGKYILVLALLFYASPTDAVGQSTFSPFHISYGSLPAANQSLVSDFSALLSFPLYIGNKSYLFGSSQFSTRSNGISTSDYNDLSLSTFSLSITYIRPLDSSKSILGIFNTGIYSDFKDISSEDYNTFASIMLNKKVNSTFSYNYGIAYNNNFYGNMIIPYFGFSKEFTPTITLQIQNPLNPTLVYKYSDTFSYGFSPEYTSRHYRLNSSLNSQVHVSTELNAATYLDVRLNPSLLLNITVGYNFMHKIRVYEDLEDTSSKWYRFSSKQTPLYKNTTEGVFMELGLKLNFGNN